MGVVERLAPEQRRRERGRGEQDAGPCRAPRAATSDVSKRTDALLGQAPQRLELRGRQRRAPPQRAGLGTREPERVGHLGARRQRRVGWYYVGGCRSLARHESPLSFPKGSPQAATSMPSTRTGHWLCQLPRLSRFQARGPRPASQAARPRRRGSYGQLPAALPGLGAARGRRCIVVGEGRRSPCDAAAAAACVRLGHTGLGSRLPARVRGYPDGDGIRRAKARRSRTRPALRGRCPGGPST